ncbi:MAG: choice-of-anchor tandem repeat GloVer-containing protein [Candidatus Sulfotelmatobacter sp.]
MPARKPSLATTLVLTLFVMATLMMATRAAAQKEAVLYNFSFTDNGVDGTDPVSDLIFDKSGSLYGMTSGGGAYGDGTVFELTPKGGGGWTETVLHNFQGADGVSPGRNGGLIFDAAGNLYGLANEGGAYGYGTVFELTPSADGWTATVLHSFSYGGTDGYLPVGSLIFDAAGNLYGTTNWGGTGQCLSEANLVGCGTVFELSPKAGGGWTEKVLHSFGNGTDGTFPVAGLVLDATGDLYGVTYEGGTGSCLRTGYAGCGIVFELLPEAGGRWAERVLHHFNLTNGGWPVGNLIFDAIGNLYGMTNGGGAYDFGTAYELMPGPKGGWDEKILHNFNQSGVSGAAPYAGLIFDSAGNLYGTTSTSGAVGSGTAFELRATTSGPWTEWVLHAFGSGSKDGVNPVDSLTFDAAGNLYGTTIAGGTSSYGTAFEIKR